MMKRSLAAALLLALLVSVSPASAFVVEVTTTVSVADMQDEAQLQRALESAVDGVLQDAIAFVPTLIVLTRALIVGDRLYLRLLIADQEGERTVNDLREDRPEPEPTVTDIQI
jgi:hypothetical protein